ncbi:MgtC/SapB family protein [Balneolaceae bacterium ANBcel3]|nr:MgtC/SapB family protein [Balneolaceae bacterium ANBcel3]
MLETELYTIFQTLGISLLLGLLVGMQRELHDTRIAGFRTFAIVTLFGTVCAYLAQELSPLVLGFGFLGVIAIIVVGNMMKMRSGSSEFGMTTEISLLLMYGVGAYLTMGPWIIAAAIAGSTAILLQIKPQLKGALARMEDKDIKAIMQFVLITFIILPILPNQTFGPFEVFNPQRTWLLVVLITGISLGGYMTYKFMGDRAGTALGGILGGIISSTATTVSYSKLTSKVPTSGLYASVVIIIASAMVYPRLAIEIAVMAPDYFYQMVWPVSIMFVVSVIVALYAYRKVKEHAHTMPQQRNPSELSTALTFGAIYVAILFIISATTEYVGPEALYLVAGISGLADMDAITLSVSQKVQNGTIPVTLGWKLILTAIISNTIFKYGIIRFVGGKEIAAKVTPAFSVVAVVALALILLF